MEDGACVVPPTQALRHFPAHQNAGVCIVHTDVAWLATRPADRGGGSEGERLCDLNAGTPL